MEVVAADEAILVIELGPNSGMHEVVFQAPEVKIGTGLVTLQGLMEGHTPGTGSEIVRVPLG